MNHDRAVRRMVNAYVEAMLWAEVQDNERPFEADFDQSDIDEKAMLEIVCDCEDFYRANQELIGEKAEQAGSDFYLTRNRHGAGFWDGDWPVEAGEKLTEAAHVYGTQGLSDGGDGKLYVHG